MANDGLRGKRKLMAARRAEFRLKQRFEAIDWELDVLTPEIERLEADGVRGLVVESSLVEIGEGDNGEGQVQS